MTEVIRTRCCIAGGGPAGLMLGFLLARAGVDVMVLEKHADFLRDFRGDTIHPSTLELMYELGILDEFLQRPHQEVRELRGQVGGEPLILADFTHLPTHCKFLAFMPQWDFLDFLVAHALPYPGFHLKTLCEVTGLIEENGGVVGVHAKTPQGPVEIRADLTVGADGRHSTVRHLAGLKSVDLGAPMDVLWMRLSRTPGEPARALGYIERGKMLVLLNRDDYWQCALVIPKGSAEIIQQRGMASLREDIVAIAPFLRDRLDELREWKDISVLTVVVDKLTRWSRPGLLCIGDAAHAMSPIGGVGINLAIQDAVSAANILAPKFLHGAPSEKDLQAVQQRRTFPTRATQRMQLVIQNNVIRRVLKNSEKPLTLAWPFKLFRLIPQLRRIPARLIGVGFRPEHIQTPDVLARPRQ